MAKGLFSLFKNFLHRISERFNLIHSETNFQMRPEVEKKIISQIIGKNIKQSLVVNFIELPIIILTYKVLIAADPNSYVRFWLIYHLLVSNALRGTFIYLYQNNYRHHDVLFWRRAYMCMAIFSGSSWGFVGAVLMPCQAPVAQIYIILVILGITSGGMPILAPLLREYTIFLFMITVPLTIRMIFYEGELTTFGLLLPCWIILTLVAAFHTRNLLLKALALQYENKNLYDETVKAKTDLEKINDNLIYEIRLRKAAEKRLESIATHDTLTGLPNRVLLYSFLNEALVKADQEKKIVCVVFIDMDNFKPINDTFGHDAGDKLLATIGQRLLHRIRQNDFACRIGGDEFMVVITNIPSPESISQIVDNVLHSIAEPYNIAKNDRVFLSASAGISIYPDDANTLDQLIKLADIAMYKAKEEGGNTFKFYNSSL